LDSAFPSSSSKMYVKSGAPLTDSSPSTYYNDYFDRAGTSPATAYYFLQ